MVRRWWMRALDGDGWAPYPPLAPRLGRRAERGVGKLGLLLDVIEDAASLFPNSDIEGDLMAATSRYGVIYADPPWTFQTGSDKGKGGSPEQHYSCLSLDEIKALPVKDLAADDCVLLLWVTWPILPRGLEMIQAWGFTY